MFIERVIYEYGMCYKQKIYKFEYVRWKTINIDVKFT